MLPVGSVGKSWVKVEFRDKKDLAEWNERKDGAVEGHTDDEYKPKWYGEFERVTELDLVASFDRLRGYHASSPQVK